MKPPNKKFVDENSLLAWAEHVNGEKILNAQPVSLLDLNWPRQKTPFTIKKSDENKVTGLKDWENGKGKK